MKTYRLAFLLGILSTSLVGCSNGGGGSTSKVKVTFNGTNCFIRNGLDDKAPEFTTLEVEKDSSQTFQIFVKEPTKYLVPDGSKVDTGDVERNYYQSTDGAGHKEGQLVLKSISHDVTITATARIKSETSYSITYEHDSKCTWDDSNPTSIKHNETLVAKITSEEPTTKDGLYVFVKGVGEIAKDNYDYDYANRTLTLDGKYVTGDITLRAFIPENPNYTVDFKMEHANATFPKEQAKGTLLYGYIYADKGYRVPTKDELAPEDEGQPYYESNIKKYAPNVIYNFRPEEFYYESYIDTETGVSTGYLVITNWFELLDAEKIEIGGTSIEQVTVTFQVGDGHWQNPSKTKEDRDGTIDKGAELRDALTSASGGEEPTVDTAGWEFGDWKDENGQTVNPGDKINQTIKVHATYKQIDYYIYSEISDKITVSPELPKSVHYNDPINEVTLTTTGSYKLPAKSEVSVTMRHIEGLVDEWLPLADSDFDYIKSTDNTATFSIKSGVITGDIKIKMAPIQYVSVTFDPNGGTWPLGGTEAKIASVPVGSTYGEAYDTLKTSGDPSKPGLQFGGWKSEDGTIVEMKTVIPASFDGIKLEANYTDVVTFQNDTWANVIRHAELGDLKATYKDTITLGAERSLSYTDPVTNEQKTYKVRIIDSGYDRYMKGGEKLVSGLTFEFVDLVGEGDYGDPYPPSPSNGKNSWWDSVYRRYLDTFYKEICEQNEGFEAKPAIKYTLHGYVTPEEQATIDPREKFETTEYFFPLSGAEIGLAGISSGANPTQYGDQQRKNECLTDGTTVWPYEYYKDNTHSRLKNIYGAEPDTGARYWLRSPHVYTPGSDVPNVTNCYIMTENGGTNKDYGGYGITADYDYGYMAAFCI